MRTKTGWLPRAAIVISLATAMSGAAHLFGAVPSTLASTGCGDALPPGSAWAGAYAARGDVTVRSNGGYGIMGTLYDCTSLGTYGPRYQCTELAQRWAALEWGEPATWMSYAYEAWANGPTLPRPLVQHPNGGADKPRFGDLLVFDHYLYDSSGTRIGDDKSGHIAVVSGVSSTAVNIVEQNWDLYGGASLPISGTTMAMRPIFVGKYIRVLGWLRPIEASRVAVRSDGASGYVALGDGTLKPFGGAPVETPSATWRGKDLTRGIALRSNGTSGYVLDAFGGIHPFGGAPTVSGGPSWPNWDIARGIALRSDGDSGYVLDGWGGLHPFGGAPGVTGFAYWKGWDIARGIALRSDGVSGYVLDGWGGVHAFGGAPATATSAYWQGQDMARGIALAHDGQSGYVLDRSGGVHPFGNAYFVTITASWPGMDIARGIAADFTSGRGVVVDDRGAVHGFTPNPPTCSTCF